ncbi:phosphonate C-P lyase system protein PhnH [Reyranella soli]|uniref:Carbon-phosphorus lyase subunit PhnH n=1 Tax=Reyranella soli TaxID=1230389 RepID=A0A512NRE0_9HYPH|nr:phosphonate C-P lyase system protein PhnH [Reyranella soli]GEP61513.1 carbon-phosphorus lyase subunit PhnH [Reyranella soli]
MSDLRTLAPGLADPSHDAQQLFRAILDAASHPGRIVSLPSAPAGPGALSSAATAYLLTLADRDTPVWLASDFDRPEVRNFLRFHAGAPIVAARAEASFGVVAAGTPQPFDGFNLGTDAYPDRSATVLIEVPDLQSGPMRHWRGPGIADRTSVGIAGLGDAFWDDWAANHALFPCGVDLVFTAGTELCALPRSIAVEV